MKIYLSVILLALSPLFVSAQNQPNYKFIKKIGLQGDGKWDYMKMDGEMEKLYVSHGDRVHVIDLVTESPVIEWTGLSKVHGISLGKAEKKVYIANTGLNNVVIYSSADWSKITTVELPEGKKPDCILFDKYSQKAFVFCGESKNAFVIDGKTDKVVATIDLGGKPEFACTDDQGFIYNNIEDTNEIVVVDVKNYKVVKRFSLAPDKAPTGITIDVKNNLLMTTCEESKNMVVLSTTGNRISTVPIGEKTDGIVYEKDLGLLITSNGGGTATIIKQLSVDKYDVIQTVNTQRGLKTIVHRGSTHRFYLSGADLQADGKTPVPGTFGVFVYGPDMAN
jgi:DNA-binding beta-propeller fold protein YncE